MNRSVLMLVVLGLVWGGMGQGFAQDKSQEKTAPPVEKVVSDQGFLGQFYQIVRPVLQEGKVRLWIDLPRKKWEYKVVQVEKDPTKMEETLNKLGEQGWEYVGTASWVSTIRSGAAVPPIQTEAFFICKRPK